MRLEELFESTIMSDEEIHLWLLKHVKKDPELHFDIVNGVINVNGNVVLQNVNEELPVQFGKVTGVFSAWRQVNLNSFRGFPSEAKYISFSHTDIRSLVGIEKQIKRTKSLDLTQTEITRGGIGVLLIEDLKELFFTPTVKSFKQKQPRKAFSIIEKYLGKPNELYDCQAELIDVGLEEYAEL